MRLKELPSCIGAYSFDSTGFNASTKQLVDQSGWGHNMALSGRATPIYATRGGHQVTDFDNTYHYTVEVDLVPPGGSMVLVGIVNMVNLGRLPSLVSTFMRKADDGNFAGYPIDNSTPGEFVGVGFRRLQNSWAGNTPRIFDNSGPNGSGAPFSAGVMGIFSAAGSEATQTLLASTGTQVPVSSGSVIASVMATRAYGTRIGQLFESGGLDSNGSVPNPYLSLKRAYFFSANVFDDPSFADARLAEMAEWGI